MDPISRFRELLARAEASEPDVPTAMTLATVAGDGRPSARVVLLRGVDERGFVFYTNYESRKARDLDTHPHAALCFHWKTLREQVRVEGAVERVDDATSDAYWNGRPQRSQLAALASQQSASVDMFATLEQRFTSLVAEHGDAKVPRPPHWGGYRVTPSSVEFWTHGDHRLHRRELFVHTGEGWNVTLLNP